MQEFHRQLFANSSDSLLQEIKRITGLVVREASAQVETITGAWFSFLFHQGDAELSHLQFAALDSIVKLGPREPRAHGPTTLIPL